MSSPPFPDPLEGHTAASCELRGPTEPSRMVGGSAAADGAATVPVVPPAEGGLPNLAGLGAELAFVQDAQGNYRAFHWQTAGDYGLDPAAVAGQPLDAADFRPSVPSEYLEQVQRVLGHVMPERFSCRFRWGGDRHEQFFDLIMSPIPVPEGQPQCVLALGRSLPMRPVNAVPIEAAGGLATLPSLPSGLEAHQKLLSKIARSIRRTLPLSSALYQILLTKISRNIRRTLDLDTIWKQTVSGLGQALSLSRCVVCSYPGEDDRVAVVAEYCRDEYPRLTGQTLSVAAGTELSQALHALEPIAVEQLSRSLHEEKSAIFVATRYQEQPNGLICLHQCDRVRHWSSAEIELVRELADQVGTAIAHATLFAESQALANELQQANISLVQKHHELEEARQQAEEVSRLKSEFLANTSHEIRTPLNGVIGFLKLILDGMVDDPEEQQDFIKEAYRSAVHLLDILNDILDIARIEADKLELNFAPVKLNELLANAENFTHGQVQQKGLYFEIQMPETHDDIVVYGDYQRLLQVLLNLTGNAIKFTHEGGVTISTEVIRKPVQVQSRDLPGLVRVRVADTGIGVSLDKQDKLFQSFSQVDGSRTRRYGGTGLGLVISQKLVEAMGGDVNFYSLGEGLGSTVTFTVPLYQEPVLVSKP